MIEARGITKRYPGVVALENVDFSVGAGEVVGLIGENGAGKSTMIKVLGGLTAPDAGEIRVDGNLVTIRSSAEATRLGIGVIHQELNNLDNLDVAGNVLLGREPRRLGLIDRPECARRASAFLRRLGLDIPPGTPLRRLSIAQQQMVEIAKALSLEARVLIMDEPTSSLTAAETACLMEVVEDLRTQGVGIVYVSHRLGEVTRLADRVVAFRDGRNAGTLAKREIETQAMVRLMVGRDIERERARSFESKPARLVVKDLITARYPQSEVSIVVGAGEIVGLAGLVGAGRSELARAIYGVDPRLGGSVSLDGKALPPRRPDASIRAGLFLAPEDRRKEGLVTLMSVQQNVTLPSLPQYARAGWVRGSAEREAAQQMRDRLGIKTPRLDAAVRNLSGGNQQKVVLAKWLAMSPRCLIVDEPTRGIDIGARSEIYGLLRNLAREGVAILMISSDMEEVLGLSDRIVVMHEGRVTGQVCSTDASEEAVMSLAVNRG